MPKQAHTYAFRSKFITCAFYVSNVEAKLGRAKIYWLCIEARSASVFHHKVSISQRENSNFIIAVPNLI